MSKQKSCPSARSHEAILALLREQGVVVIVGRRRWPVVEWALLGLGLAGLAYMGGWV